MAEILVGRPARISIGEPAVPAEVPGSGWAWRFVATGCRREDPRCWHAAGQSMIEETTGFNR